MAFSITEYGFASLPFASFPIAGTAPGVGAAYSITALNGSYALTGQSANIYQNRNLTGGYGSYALTGQSATLSRGFLLSLQNGLYSLSGQSISISYNPPSPVTGPTQYLIEIRSFTERRRI